jgi:hypothetical protein
VERLIAMVYSLRDLSASSVGFAGESCRMATSRTIKFLMTPDRDSPDSVDNMFRSWRSKSESNAGKIVRSSLWTFMNNNYLGTILLCSPQKRAGQLLL